MKLEHQVISLDLAKRLKELGVKQGSYFSYEEIWGKPDYELMQTIPGEKRVAAFTVAELGEMLLAFDRKHPEMLGFRSFADSYGKVVCGWDTQRDITGDTEAEARGRMLAYLIENNLLAV